MKIRTGFVSNSSSSSFIVAIKEDTTVKCPTCGRGGFLGLLDLVEKLSYNNDDNSVECEGMKEVQNYLEGCIADGWEEDNAKVQEAIDQLPTLKKEGYKFAVVSLSNHETILHEIMNSSPNIKVLYHTGY